MVHPQGELLEDEGYVLMHNGDQQFFATEERARAAATKMYNMDHYGGSPYYIVKATRLAHQNYLNNWRA